MASETKTGSGDKSVKLPPHVEWAQRKDRVYVTVILENCKNPSHKLDESTFYFSGTGGTENQDHEVTLKLFAEIDPEKSSCHKNDRQTVFTLIKKDQDTEYWPRLTCDKIKRHFLKIDFNRWRDEDDSEEEEKEDFNLDEMMNSMGGLNGGNFGAPPGEEEDSDDEELPDLQ